MKSNVESDSKWYKLGGKIYDYRRIVCSFVLVISLLLSYFALDLPNKLGGDGFKTNGDYIAVQEILEDEFNQSPNSIIFIIQKEKGASEEQFTEGIQSVVDLLSEEKNIQALVHPFMNSEMRKEDTANISFSYDEKDIDKITELNEQLATKVSKLSNDEVTVLHTGATFMTEEMNEQSMNDLKKAELIGVPIAFVILFFAFGSLVASVVPLIIGGLTILTSFGILTFLADKIDLSIYVTNVAPMIGLALSIDFALLYISRYRQEVKTKSIRESLAVSFATAGRSIIFSGLCVFIGLCALAIIDIELFQSVAISGATVVAIAILFSLTILPATIGLLGKHLFKGSIKFVQNRIDDNSNKMWRRFADFVMKRPIFTAIGAFVLLVVCILPIRSVNLDIPTFDALPEQSAYRAAYEIYETEFLSDTSDHAKVMFMLKSKSSFTESEQLKEAETFINKLEADKDVYRLESYFNTANVTAEQTTGLLLNEQTASQIQPVYDAFIQEEYMYINVFLKDEPKSSEAKEWVREKDGQYETEQLEVTIGGETKFEQELYDAIWNKIGYGLLIIFVSTFLILMYAFKSILIPLKAIVMNVLSLGATFGIVTWLFQNGHFGLPETYIMLILPVFIFGLVFGLSMDYEVFLISRIQEEYQKSGNNDYATKEGLVSTSKIITSAAAIMIVVTGAFAFTDMIPVKQMGIGIAIAIFLDATIIRLLLVPSLMKLLGDWNWWMPFAKTHKPKEDKAG